MSLHELIGATRAEGLVTVDGQQYYLIPDVEMMAPFLMSVVSDGDRWMFISSEGALTAGRRDATQALFPYETDDRLHDASGISGSSTLIRTVDDGSRWHPFQPRVATPVGRRVAKSVSGDAVIFEEDHPVLPLTVSYRWSSCEEFGFIRSTSLVNRGDAPIRLQVIDGVLNVNPYGVDLGLQQSMRNLSHAYKRSQVIDCENGFAVFSLEAQIADRPAPVEVMKATTMWHTGGSGLDVTLDRDAVMGLARGELCSPSTVVTGRPGAYLLQGDLVLDPERPAEWSIVCDVARDHSNIQALLNTLGSVDGLEHLLSDAVGAASERLVRLMASADAMSNAGDGATSANHVANVTYNVMRGGIPVDGYRISTSDYCQFIKNRNQRVFEDCRAFLDSLPGEMALDDVLAKVSAEGQPHLVRLTYEYLPFAFSRRHGDPSRPWNTFSIQVQDDSGELVCHYEGNWRDIFQNWEALCTSFPGYLTSALSVFVNASTVDGFNPYRISREGVDWEVPEPENPWSNIGYWGDHQIAYLLALLEASERYRPGEVRRLFNERFFSYADVPYRIVGYDSLMHDPKATISFDDVAHEQALHREADIGGDGRLVWRDGEVALSTLAEKLLIPALAKIANFVPGGGIWMNTQRPEWNDANNALTGYGLSMVTLFQLRRYLAHLVGLIRDVDTVELSRAVADWLTSTLNVFAGAEVSPEDPDDAALQRLQVMSGLGAEFEAYRTRAYAGDHAERCVVDASHIAHLCASALAHLDATIAASRRDDGLYHSYNILRIDRDAGTASVERLPLMLEGQVAAVGSGVLGPSDTVQLLEALFDSALYRADAKSFVLYPPVAPPTFMAKNIVDETAARAIPLLSELLDHADRSILVRDADGRIRFCSDIADRESLHRALATLSDNEVFSRDVETSAAAVVALYEDVFGHHTYTGRSSSMYSYEGIGSVYWHMTAKLLVAIQTVLTAVDDDADSDGNVAKLVELYWRVRQGSGRSKTAAEWGAVPTDPYSHSPAHSGAQQPGMTGLAKEEILARQYELGLVVRDGCIHIDPVLLRGSEFVADARTWQCIGADQEFLDIKLPANSFGYTVCQVPVIVQHTGDRVGIQVECRGETLSYDGFILDADVSREVFLRSGAVSHIVVTLHASA